MFPVQAQGARETGSEDERHRCRRRVRVNNPGLTTRLPVSQSIKEVVQSLVDDGLVQYDKIGSSNCTYSVVSRSGETHIFRLVFWSFPSQQGALVGTLPSREILYTYTVTSITRFPILQVQNRLSAAQEMQRGLQQQLTELRAAVAAEKADRFGSVCLLSFNLSQLMDSAC